MELKSVKKKYKSKNFAAGCSRDVIERGAYMLDWDLDKLINKTAEDFKTVGLELVTPFSDKEFGNIVYRLINTRNYCLRENFLKNS